MTWLWEHSTASGTELLVLLAIADAADDQGGNAWPSTATIARKCRISDRTVQRIVARLVDAGQLEVKPNAGRAGTNLFRVLMRRQKPTEPTTAPAPEVTPEHPDTTPDRLTGVTDRRGDNGVTTPPTPVSGEPSLNRPLPPYPRQAGGAAGCSPETKPHPNCRGCGTNARAVRDAKRRRRPPWCGRCVQATRMTDDDRPRRCPTCHPSTAPNGDTP